jgi:hypothetical protein
VHPTSPPGVPYRTAQVGARFHHNRESCPVGELIERADRRYGPSGLPLCSLCEADGSTTDLPAPHDAERAAQTRALTRGLHKG